VPALRAFFRNAGVNAHATTEEGVDLPEMIRNSRGHG
jgi:hypothetical protein